jgi:broad specificity phosphatase PhoE
MVIYLMRHAESEWNIDPSSTRKDPSITENGRIQASQVELQVDVLYCSPLRRAKETLECSKIKAEKIIEWIDLREVGKDPCDFLEFEQVIVESVENIKRRVEIVLEKMKELSKEDKVVLFLGHSDLFYHLTGYDLDLCEVIQFDPNSRVCKMIHWNIENAKLQN